MPFVFFICVLFGMKYFCDRVLTAFSNSRWLTVNRKNKEDGGKNVEMI